MSWDCGAQAQKVSVVGFCRAAAMAAAVSAAGVDELPGLLPLLLQAARPASSATPAAAAAVLQNLRSELPFARIRVPFGVGLGG
jgi:hypothetical protein